MAQDTRDVNRHIEEDRGKAPPGWKWVGRVSQDYGKPPGERGGGAVLYNEETGEYRYAQTDANGDFAYDENGNYIVGERSPVDDGIDMSKFSGDPNNPEGNYYGYYEDGTAVEDYADSGLARTGNLADGGDDHAKKVAQQTRTAILREQERRMSDAATRGLYTDEAIHMEGDYTDYVPRDSLEGMIRANPEYVQAREQALDEMGDLHRMRGDTATSLEGMRDIVRGEGLTEADRERLRAGQIEQGHYLRAQQQAAQSAAERQGLRGGMGRMATMARGNQDAANALYAQNAAVNQAAQARALQAMGMLGSLSQDEQRRRQGLYESEEGMARGMQQDQYNEETNAARAIDRLNMVGMDVKFNMEKDRVTEDRNRQAFWENERRYTDAMRMGAANAAIGYEEDRTDQGEASGQMIKQWGDGVFKMATGRRGGGGGGGGPNFGYGGGNGSGGGGIYG